MQPRSSDPAGMEAMARSLSLTDRRGLHDCFGDEAQFPEDPAVVRSEHGSRTAVGISASSERVSLELDRLGRRGSGAGPGTPGSACH
jgi:hypothetical protein